MIIVPFKEKPITGRGGLSPVLMYTPYTQAELRALAKEFPNPSQDPLGCIFLMDLTIGDISSVFRSMSINTAISF